MAATYTDQSIERAQKIGVLRPHDLDEYGIPRHYLHRMWQSGILERIDRGLYVSKKMDPSENHSPVEASRRVSGGVICLLSALQSHELTSPNPFEVWMAIREKARRPTSGTLSLQIVRFSGQAFSAGIEVHLIEGVKVKIYHPAKTVADCFKYRNKIGLDIAIEALRDALTRKRETGGRACTVDDLLHYAKICRVTNIMQPYLEAISGGV